MTYQYFNFPMDIPGWLVDQPRLDKYSFAKSTMPLWGCLTGRVTGDDFYFSHAAFGDGCTPTGMNVAYIDGSSKWIKWADTEDYYTYSAYTFNWPKPVGRFDNEL